jgi:uroporphyrinogen-III synthase
MKLKRILISQPKPDSDKSPWLDLPGKHKVTLDFKPFIHVEGISAAEFRKQKIDISHYTCIILNSRNAVDHYFRMASELRFTVPEKTKYFCTTEAIALYLQKYIQYRKRKIFFAQQSIDELVEPIRKNRDEKFLFVCSDKATDKTTALMESNKIDFTQAIFYKTVSSDMKSVDVPGYEMIIFFSPNGIQSLFENFPDFKQGNIRIGLFGTTTYAAAKLRGLRVDLAAPLPNAPSMTMALDLYIKEFNAKNGEVQPMVNFPVPATSVTAAVKPAETKEITPAKEKVATKKIAVKKEKPAPKVAVVKKSTPAKKTPVKSKPIKKSAAKKGVTTKTVVKKSAPKKAAPKKAAPKKAAPKKVVSKKVTPKTKSVVKKSAPVKKTKAVKKATPKKVVAKKAVVKAKPAKPIRTAGKKVVAKKKAVAKPSVKVTKKAKPAPAKKKVAAKKKR